MLLLRYLPRTAASVGLAFVLASGCASPEDPADLVFFGGAVYTLDERAPWAEAIAVRGERIVAVGPRASIESLIGEATETIDLDGRLVLPGFSDARAHFLSGARQLDWLSLWEANTVDDALELLRVRNAAEPGQGWLLGRGLSHDVLSTGVRQGIRERLDTIVTARPVLFLARDGRAAWANTTARNLAGVEPSRVVTREQLVRLMEAVPRLTPEQELEAFEAGIAYAHRFGITSVRDTSATDGTLAFFAEASTRGLLELRFAAAMDVKPTVSQPELDLLAARRGRFRQAGLRAHAVRLQLDDRLEPAWDPTALEAVIRRLDRFGYPVVIRAADQATTSAALDVLERAVEANGDKPRRYGIEPSEDLDPNDIERLASMGVVVVLRPRDIQKPLGDATQVLPLGSLERAGIRVMFGSDWPLAPIDPLVGIYTAVTRQDLRGRPEGGWLPEQRMSVEEAVRAYTEGSAFFQSEEAERGAIRVGLLADLAVLSENILKIPEDRIADVGVEMTVFAGKPVYIAASFLTPERRKQLLSR